MARPIYAYEMGDPDFSWLISSFRESHPGYIICESPLLPVVLVPAAKQPEFLALPERTENKVDDATTEK